MASFTEDAQLSDMSVVRLSYCYCLRLEAWLVIFVGQVSCRTSGMSDKWDAPRTKDVTVNIAIKQQA